MKSLSSEKKAAFKLEIQILNFLPFFEGGIKAENIATCYRNASGYIAGESFVYLSPRAIDLEGHAIKFEFEWKQVTSFAKI